jgi:ABC-type branched-subunit amino acid transport system ATPase component
MVLFEAASRQLECTGLSDVAFELASALSLGQMRLLEVARALALDPLLDEPAATKVGLHDTNGKRTRAAGGELLSTNR